MILFYAFWLLVNLLRYYFLIITKFVHFPKVVNFLKRMGIAPLTLEHFNQRFPSKTFPRATFYVKHSCCGIEFTANTSTIYVTAA